ncbi:MurR/RpiR family transcriptional regulator [Thermus scotoductus]|uniref:MurR/RpiR family transcriptional regulator n=1 Tax=Thermus scotoductus TaxID=37636 RepID=UPI0020A53702|nr:MurR/RpiR family transcriptional regulator [Thermus scotoductus]
MARVLLERPGEAVRASIRTLAEMAGVSPAAVTRLSRRLGFKDFRDLKVALALELGSLSILPPSLEVRPGDSPEQVLAKVFRAEVQALEEALRGLNGEAFRRAAELLLQARRIGVFGVGSSVPVALDAYYRFLRIGLNVFMAPETHMQAVVASLMGPEDVGFFVSHTGRSRELLDSVRETHRAGAKIVALTSFSHSPLVDRATVALIAPVRETTFRVEAMATRVVHMAVIDALYVTLALSKPEASWALARSQEAIDAQRV